MSASTQILVVFVCMMPRVRALRNISARAMDIAHVAQRSMRHLAIIASAFALAGCAAPEPKTSAIISRAVPDGYARLYVLRDKQTVYSFMPVRVSVDGRTIGTLGSGTYLATDVPAGKYTLTVAVLLSRAITGLDLAPGESLYVDVAMKPSGLPPLRGAVRVPPERTVAAESGVFSISFLDERAATTVLATLSPAD